MRLSRFTGLLILNAGVSATLAVSAQEQIVPPGYIGNPARLQVNPIAHVDQCRNDWATFGAACESLYNEPGYISLFLDGAADTDGRDRFENFRGTPLDQPFLGAIPNEAVEDEFTLDPSKEEQSEEQDGVPPSSDEAPAPISEEEVDAFRNVDLRLLDNQAYFRAVFG